MFFPGTLSAVLGNSPVPSSAQMFQSSIDLSSLYLLCYLTFEQHQQGMGASRRWKQVWQWVP
jgi:hypothetical protein